VSSKKQAARKRTTTTTVEEPRLEDEEPLDAFERARAEFSGGPKVTLTIYRYDDGATAYLKRVGYEPEVVNEEWIRKKWGPGSYQLRFMDPENPSTRWSRVVEIAADVPTSSPAPASHALGEHFVLSMLQRQNEIMLQALVGARGAAAPAGGDAFAKLIEGMQAQNTELLKASLARPDMSSTILTVFEKGLQIAGEAKLESEGGWLAQLGRVARDLIPALAEMSKMRGTVGPVYPGVVTATTPRTPPALPAGKPNGEPSSPPGFVATAAASPPATPSPPTSSSADEALRQFAPQILEAARGGASPAAVAEGILQAIPPMFYPELDALTPEKLISAEAGLEAHRAFIEKLLAALKEPDDDDDGAGVPSL
jgi:hypothetical protein